MSQGDPSLAVVQMVDRGGVEVLQERHVQGGEFVPCQGHPHEGRRDAFGHRLHGVQVRAVIVTNGVSFFRRKKARLDR